MTQPKETAMMKLTYVLSLALLMIVFLINLAASLTGLVYFPVWVISAAVFSPVAHSQAKKRGRHHLIWTMWTALGAPIFTNILLLVLGNTDEQNEANWKRQADAIAKAAKQNP